MPTTNSPDVIEARLAALEAKKPPPPTPEQLAAKQERALREQREQYEWTIKERQMKLTADMGQRYSQARASLETFKTYHAAQSPIMDKVQGIALDLPKLSLRVAG